MARENPGMFSIDCLEKIARYDKELQKSVFEGNKPSVPYEGDPPVVWEDYRYDFRNLSCELKDAVFCTKECESCMKNSACQPMLFDDPKDKKGRTLGRCMDEACFKRKQEDHIAAERVKLEKKYGKIREVKNSWDVPGCATQKKTKDNTVPYIVSSMRDGSGGGIMWGRPEPKKSEADKQDAKAEKLRKKIEKSACAKISEWCDNHLKDTIAAILGDEGTRVVNAKFLAKHLYSRIDAYLGGYGALEEASIVYMTFMRGEESSREDAYRLTDEEEKVVRDKWDEVSDDDALDEKDPEEANGDGDEG